MDHNRFLTASKGNYSQTHLRHQISAGKPSRGMPLLTNSSSPAASGCQNKLAQMSHRSLETGQGREGGGVGVGEGEGLFPSLQTSSFIPDKSDRWKAIKKKPYSQAPSFSGEVSHFSPLHCSNFLVLTQGKWAKAAFPPRCHSPLV